MTSAATQSISALDDARLRSLLASASALRPQGGGAIARVRRAPGAYHSSFAIEDVELTFDDGSTRSLVLKDLTPAALPADARRAKPAFLDDPRREIETYRHVLGPYGITAPALIAAAVDDARQSYALLLENIDGVPLWQIGEWDTWLEAARWLAATHDRLAGAAPSLAAPARLLRYDADYYAFWRDRLRRFSRPMTREILRAYDQVVRRLLELPRTVIHGEFHASNILVEQASPASRIRPVDWEMAAYAPGLMDLADLCGGKWSAEQRNGLAEAYRGRDADAQFHRDLDCCRVHRAVQWTCWAEGWSPPAEHAQDWPGEAARVAAGLGLL